MELKQIGIIHSSFKTREEAPRQGRLSNEVQIIEVFPEFIEGLQGIKEITHLIILYWLHQADRNKLKGKPPISNKIKGVFMTRSPNRPNPIAFSIAEVLSVDGNKIKVTGLDALDGTPLLDMKVYSPDIDCIKDAQVKWEKKD